MIRRRLEPIVKDRLEFMPAVAILGPRQAGKTTLARMVSQGRQSIYLDLESPLDREKLADPEFYLSAHEDELVIMDEVQRIPELFQSLRGLIDRGRERGKRSGRFLLLGSASGDLLRQSETLAGRIAYVELSPFDILEVGDETDGTLRRLWTRGGFPESFLATSDARSLHWRQDFIRTYLERDIPQFVARIPATTLSRFWTMLAHVQGGLFNAAQLARGLAVDGKTIARYLDLMVDLMLVRRLQPFHGNFGKRLVKAPKVFIRDSGVLHALLNIPDNDALLGHPSRERAGRDSRWKISLGPLRKTPLRSTTEPALAPKSTCCWRSPAMVCGLLRSSSVFIHGRGRDFTLPVRIFGPRNDLWSIRGMSARQSPPKRNRSD